MSQLDIIIVTYNSADTILPCLQSLSPAFPENDFRVILIDNNSYDATVALLNDWGTNAKPNKTNLSLLTNEVNTGFTHAVNQGLQQSHAPFVLLLNPDTVLPVDALETLLLLFEEDDGIGVVAPQLINENGSIQPSCRRLPKRMDVLYHLFGLNLIFPTHALLNGWKMGDFDHKSARYVDQPQGAFLLCKKAVLQQVGFLDERFPMFFSDVDLCHRILLAGWKIRFSPDVAVMHHQGKSIHAKRAKMILSSHRSFIRYFSKYGRGIKWIIPNILTTILLFVTGFIRFLATFVRRNNRK